MSSQRHAVKHKEHHHPSGSSTIDLLNNAAKEFKMMQATFEQESVIFNKMKQEQAAKHQESMALYMQTQQLQVEIARQRYQSEKAFEQINRLLQYLPHEIRARTQNELERAKAEHMMNMMPGAMMAQQQAAMMALAAGSVSGANNANIAAAMAAMMPQHLASLQKHQQQQQQHQFAGQLAQLAALSAAGGIPPGMALPSQLQIATSMAACMPPTSVASPRVLTQNGGGTFPMPTPPSQNGSSSQSIAAPQSTPGSRSRKRSSPHTPLAGDTPSGTESSGAPPMKQENGGAAAMAAAVSAAASRGATPIEQKPAVSTPEFNSNNALAAITSLANAAQNGGGPALASFFNSPMGQQMQGLPPNFQAMMANPALFNSLLQAGMVTPSS